MGYSKLLDDLDVCISLPAKMGHAGWWLLGVIRDCHTQAILCHQLPHNLSSLADLWLLFNFHIPKFVFLFDIEMVELMQVFSLFFLVM